MVCYDGQYLKIWSKKIEILRKSVLMMFDEFLAMHITINN